MNSFTMEFPGRLMTARNHGQMGGTDMKQYLDDIKKRTSGMERKKACEYIFTYYWYYMLGFSAVIALILLFAVHYGFGNKKPVFTCIIVNQESDMIDGREMADSFAEKSGLPRERVVVDANYYFSFDEIRLNGVNESSYEKFFFQWQNQEIDAVILSESLYRHCKEMGGRFYTLEDWGIENFTAYIDEGEYTAVILGYDSFMEKVAGRKEEKLLLAFPSSGKNITESKKFLQYLCDEWKGQTGGKESEKAVDRTSIF